MSKTERAKQMTFADDYAEYAKSKKPHTALKVVGGIAGTAAVLAGAVFGLNCLNEHGGLKERTDISTGAGYHETTSSENDPTSGGVFLTQSDKDLLEGNATPAVDIPEGTRYDFNGFYVEPRWCTFDGMTLHLAYDVVYEGELPADIENSVKIESENGLISGYILNRSDDCLVMKASVCYPQIVRTAQIDLVSGTDGTCYTFTAEVPESVHLFSTDLLGTDIPIKDTGITKKLTHIDASSSGFSLTFENKPEVRGIAKQLHPIIMLNDGTVIRPAATMYTQDWYERQEGDKLLIRFTTQSFEPSYIDEIRVNDIIVYLSSSPAESQNTEGKDVIASFLYDGGIKVNVRKYEFDGKTLNLYYDVVFDDNNNIESEKRNLASPKISYFALCESSSRASTISETETILSMVETLELSDSTEKVIIYFLPSDMSAETIPDMTKIEYSYTATVNSDSVTPVLEKGKPLTTGSLDGIPIIDPYDTETESKLGVSMCVTGITNRRIEFIIAQNGGTVDGEILYTPAYWIEKKNGDKWEELPTLTREPAVWNAKDQVLERGTGVELGADFNLIYGDLSVGEYRLCKNICCGSITETVYAGFMVATEE